MCEPASEPSSPTVNRWCTVGHRMGGAAIAAPPGIAFRELPLAEPIT